MDRVGGNGERAGARAFAKDEFAAVALLGGAVREDALEGPPAGLAYALTGERPDHVIRSDGHHVR